MGKITFGTVNGRKLNRHHLPINSIGTFGVNGRQVTAMLPTTRGDKFHVNYSQFCRLAPLVAPTFGSFQIRTLAFFVPAHSIWTGYRNYVSRSVDTSTHSSPLNFSIEDLCYFLTGQQAEAAITPASSWNGRFLDKANAFVVTGSSNLDTLTAASAAYDIVFFKENSSNTWDATCANFTSEGRAFWNTLICLGYNFPMAIQTDQSKTTYTNFEYSLFPLLAYARVNFDYLYPSQYVAQQGFGYLFTQKIYDLWCTPATRPNVFDDILKCVFTQYDQSFQTSLWALPTSVGVGQQNNINAYVQEASNNPTSNQLNVRYKPNNSPGRTEWVNDTIITGPSVGYPSNLLSASALRWLEALADFTTRNNLGGTRFREFMKSHFGYNTTNDTCDESVFLKSWIDKVNIQDVTNTTSGSINGALGELAGKGYSAGNGTLKFEAKESGFLIFVSDVKPIVGYYQGDRPWARAIKSPFDLYTPEFDGVGMEGVPYPCVIHSLDKPNDYLKVPVGYSQNSVFGFAPRYAERYKIGHDNLFGDFRFASRNTGLDSWHTMRDVLYGRDSNDRLALDSKFLHLDNQYQRIFRYMGNVSSGVTYDVEDKLWSFFSFDITKYSTAKSLGASVPMFDESGQKATTGYEGTDIK